MVRESLERKMNETERLSNVVNTNEIENSRSFNCSRKKKKRTMYCIEIRIFVRTCDILRRNRKKPHQPAKRLQLSCSFNNTMGTSSLKKKKRRNNSVETKKRLTHISNQRLYRFNFK